MNVLNPDYYNLVLLEIARLKVLGVPAVTLSIHFPLLYRPYLGENLYLLFVNFYSRLAGDLRANGLKIIVETQVLIPDEGPAGAPLTDFYNGLTWQEHVAGRAEVADTIAQVIRPDFLTVLSEPDTEAQVTGKHELDSVPGCSQLVYSIVRRLKQRPVPGMKIGAGAGTWHHRYRELATSFCRNTPVDYFSIHLYPVMRGVVDPVTGGIANFPDRAIEIADIAAFFRKTVALGEAWPFKKRRAELGQDISPGEIFARDPFSFWARLDTLFLRMTVKLAHYKKFEFHSPFWSRYFHAYVQYDDSTKDLSPEEIDRLAFQAARTAMINGAFTSTGTAYSSFILP